MINRTVTDKDISEMARRIVAAKPVKVILFGSRPRGTARLNSDVDLLVIARDPVSRRREAARRIIGTAHAPIAGTPSPLRYGALREFPR